MKKLSTTVIVQILACLVAAVVLFALVRYIVAERFADLELETKVLITEQAGLLATIAETMARNGADQVTEQIIRDCSVSERTAFDTLLSRLNTGLSRSELTELERLFGRCGNFYAERKSVMAARLEREVEIYDMFVEQLANISGTHAAESYSVTKWRELVELERKQSNLFSELVTTQDQIITTLLTGKSATSPEIVQILENAQSIQETLIVTSAQAAEVRAALVSL
jgi:hypothetical protein